MKITLLNFIAISVFGFAANAQNVNIPDANFKAYLVGNTNINTNSDTEIQVSEASAFAGTVDCSIMSISDLTGIESFTSLTRLRCGGNSLSALDVTQNTGLTYISCTSNSISTLDVSQCSSLDTLYCYSNSLTSLDVSLNTGLSEFLCQDNQLATLNLSQNPNLNELWCANNQLTDLNLANSNNTNISKLYLQNNPNLTCIQVDDEVYSTNNWIGSSFAFDAASSFSENCNGGVGINELLVTTMNVYPNPSSIQITINTEQQIESVMIFDLSGYLMQTATSETISIENLSSGVYIAKVKTLEGTSRMRFVKE